uniref:Quinol:cytochrome c oxidoreductase quinone-binding subunit 2 n=1 Tax=mine drainage metagenome TaxID=410659 RepID=E6QL40_9ZZZZ
MAHAAPHAKVLPADLSAPSFVKGWRARSLVVAVLFAVTAVVLATLDHSAEHIYRAWVLGLMLTFGFSVGGLALLMVQYVTGGKWGLLLRRPLEAMSRTLPLVFAYWIVAGLWMKHLYLWAQFSDTVSALRSGLITEGEAHAIDWKRPMLNPSTFWITGIVCFAIWAFYTWRLNGMSMRREADSPSNTPYWIRKLENISGFGIVVYSLTMTAAVIYWVMSMDVTWYSSVYGLLFLVGQGYQVLALAILTSISLSKAEPYKTILRQTEQYDLGKFTFAFVMLNIYLAFSQFLIIWSGNLPEEIVWYMNRINGHWGIILTLDFMFHWLVPFSLLLSKDIKKNKKRLMRVAQWMIFAKALDLFWLIEPNYKDAAQNLHFSWGILEYVAVPVAMVSLWVAYYCWELTRRPLVQTNDPHLAEILEPEHAHA